MNVERENLFQRIREHMSRREGELDVSNSFDYIVQALHRDGSSFLLTNATYENDVFEGFLIVYTEHNGNFLFEKEDLKHWMFYGSR